MLWRIQGVLAWEDKYWCDCEFCEGHGTRKTLTKNIDEIIDCQCESCVELVINRHIPREILDDSGAVEEAWWWMYGPKISECPPDKAMRLAGYVGWWDDLCELEIRKEGGS